MVLEIKEQVTTNGANEVFWRRLFRIDQFFNMEKHSHGGG